MDDGEKLPIRATDLLGLRVPHAPAVAPGSGRVVFGVAEPDFAKSDLRAQLHEVWLDRPTDAGSPDEPATHQLTYALHDAEQPSISPDGKQLGFLSFRPQPHEEDEDDRREDGDDKRQVFLLPLAGGEARRLTEAAEGVEAFRFCPDGSGVLFLGQAPRAAAERAARRRRADNRDDAVIVHAERPSWELWHQPFDGPARRLLGGRRSLEEFALSPDGKQLLYNTNHTGLPRDREKLEVILRDLESGQERRLTNGRGGAEGGAEFSQDGKYALLHAWADPQFPYAGEELLAVALDDPSAVPRPLLAALDQDLEEFVPLCDGTVAAIVGSGLESRLVRVDPATGATRVVPIEGWVLRDLAAAPDRAAVALIAERADRAPEVAWVDLDAAAPDLRLITELNDEVQDWRLARRERVQWENEGLRHEGVLIRPNVADRASAPTLVWLHGGPHWRALDTLRLYEAEALASEGWALFAPQYRGSSGYGAAYARASRGDLGGADARDILAGIDALIAAGKIDPARLAIGGASYGGYLTNWLLATTSRFRAGISMMGIFDFGHDWAGSEFESWEEHYFGGRPWEQPERYRERSPMSRVASIEAPLLILHGTDDDNTPLANSRALHRALVGLGRETQLVIYPREGHGLAEPAHRLDCFRRIRAWLQQHVGAASSTWVEGEQRRGEQVTLTLLGNQPRRDYAGLRPQERRGYVEIAFLIRADEDGPTSLRLTPAGPDADVMLVDRDGARFRPIGVPLDVHGQLVLFDGRGHLEAGIGEDDRPPTLPVACVFEVPDQPAVYELHVAGFTPITLELDPHPDEP